MPPPLRYRHTQFGTVVVGSLVASALVLVGLGLTYHDPVFTLGGPVIMGIVALLFYDLTVEIDATHLTFHFGLGLIRKRIPLAEIVEVQPVRNSWLSAVPGVLIYKEFFRLIRVTLAKNILKTQPPPDGSWWWLTIGGLNRRLEEKAAGSRWFAPRAERPSGGLKPPTDNHSHKNKRAGIAAWLYGWGIHRTPHGWLYNVSGWEAVEITLASGKRLRLGTDEPQRLARALLAAKQERD